MFRSSLGARAAQVGMILLIVGSTTAAGANASADAQSHHAPVLRPQLQAVSSAGWIWTGSRYALLGPTPGTANQAVMLIDDQTGRRTTISRAGCSPIQPSADEPLDLPLVPFNCSTTATPAPALYSPSTRRWRTVSPSPAITDPCGDYSYLCDIQDFLAAAGSRWLEYIQSDCPMDEHCSFSNVFQNIDTGEVRKDPSGGRTTIDLNAANLPRTLCRPLTEPTAAQLFAGPGPGSMIFSGSFALAIGTDENAVPEVHLERCGTHLHRLLTKGPYPAGRLAAGANTREAVWMTKPRPFLNALSLPSLTPFTIKLPRRILDGACSPSHYLTCVSEIALTQHRLYLLITPTQQLWAAPIELPRRSPHK